MALSKAHTLASHHRIKALIKTLHEKIYTERGHKFIAEFYVDLDYTDDGGLIITREHDAKDATEAAGMPSETTGFLYADLDQALPTVFGLTGFSGRSTPDWLERNLEPLQSLVLYGERDGDVAKLVGLLSIQ